MNKLITMLIAVALLVPAASLSTTGPANVTESYGTLPLHFEPNLGQTDPSVKFLARADGYTLFLTNVEAVLAFDQEEFSDESQAQTSSRAVLRMQLIGAAREPHVEGHAQLSGVSN